MTSTHLSHLDRSASASRLATGRVTLAPSGTPAADVLVTDGYHFVHTDAAGRYLLPLDDQARWVQVINPSGTLPDAMLYSMIPDQQQTHQADFPLKPINPPADEPFTFAHLTDSHVSSPYRGQRLRMEFIDTLNRMPRQPAFVIDGGDLCINSPHQLEIATGVSQRYHMPYLATIGNHDRPRRDTFEAHARPCYHAFTYHRYLILSLPWGEELSQAYAWSKHLLEMMDKTMHVLVSVHHPEGLQDHHDQFMELFHAHSVRAMLCGHYHVNHARVHEGIPLYIMRGAVARNSDNCRPSFTLIHAQADGQIRIEQREVDCHQQLHLITPDRSAVLAINQLQQIWVDAYDSSSHVQSIHAQFHDAGPTGQLLAEVKLTQANAHLWTASFTPDASWQGRVYLTIQAIDTAGQYWKPIHVIRSAGDAQRTSAAPVSVKWVQSCEGSFNFGSVATYDNLIIAGVEHLSEVHREQPVLLAMDAATGQVQWTYAMAGVAVRSTPLIHQGKAIAQLDDGRVLCVDARSGKLEWIREGISCESQFTQIFARCSPIMVDDKDILIGGRESYQRLNLSDGQPVWSQISSTSHRGALPPSAVLAGRYLVTIQHKHIRVLDAAQGSLQWAMQVMHTHTRPTVHQQVLYTIVRQQGLNESPWSAKRWHNDLIALDLATGQPLWTTTLSHIGEVYSSPVVLNDKLLVVDYDTLVIVDQATGHIEHRIDFSQAVSEREYLLTNDLCSAAMYEEAQTCLVTGTPVIQGQHLYLVTIGGTVVSIHLTDRKLQWFYPLQTYVNASPVVDGQTLYVTGHQGGVVALTLHDES